MACQTCGQWFHTRCQSIDTLTYQQLGDSKEGVPWQCAFCGNPNSQTAFDLHGADWSVSDFSSINLPSPADSCSTPTESHFQHPQHASTPTQASQQNQRKNRSLRVVSVNFQPTVRKKAEVLNLLDSVKPDVVFGITWLSSDINSAEIFPDIFAVYRKD